MRQLPRHKYTAMASRHERQLLVQRMWPLSQDERSKSTAHQARQTSPHHRQKDRHQLFELQYINDHTVASQWRRPARMQRLWSLLQITQGKKTNSRTRVHHGFNSPLKISM
jgi:hypothetical protein